MDHSGNEKQLDSEESCMHNRDVTTSLTPLLSPPFFIHKLPEPSLVLYRVSALGKKVDVPVAFAFPMQMLP